VAVYLHTPATCQRCGQELPAGSRVKRAFRGYTHQQHCRRPVAAVSETPREDLPATERQVAYALACNAVVGPGERYTVEQLRALTRAQISQVITLRSDLL
jgi:hypothetical protein